MVYLKEVVGMTSKEIKYLEETIADLKESRRFIVPDWLTKINKLQTLEEFMNLDFSGDIEKIVQIAENLQQELKGHGIHVKKNKLVYFDGKEIYPIK